MTHVRLGLWGALLALLIVGCGDDDRPPPPGSDAGLRDGATDDGGPTDGGPRDGGLDGGELDAGDVDAGPADAGFDAGPTPSAQIAAVRATADGTELSLEVRGAMVTYVKPALGDDPAGFFVQAEATGPALFVAIEASTLTPAPGVGDEVAFTVTELTTAAQQQRVTAITDWAQLSTGNDITGLVQGVSSATDLVTALDDYESELITVTATVAAGFAAAGAGHVAAAIDTAGITGDTNLRLRLPTTLRDSLELVQGCQLTVTTGIVWRFNAVAQISAWEEADVTVTSCPAPTVVSAIATSPTEVVVTFDRSIDPASITDAATQITFSGGLGGTAAAVDGTQVTVTTTAQTVGTVYTVTVASTVMDLLGAGVDAAANTATFSGFMVPAAVRINELNANITSGCDLIELRVISGGSMEGYTLYERADAVLTFPAGFVVATNDLIVVHFNRANTACTGGVAAPADETTAVDEVPAATVSSNYDTAFDFYSTDAGLTATDNVFVLRDALGTILDAVLVSDDPTGTAAAASEAAAIPVASAGEWEMVGGGVPAGGFVDDDFSAHAVLDLNATGTSPAGESIQRLNDADTNTMADWTQAASSWGALNAGQSPL